MVGGWSVGFVPGCWLFTDFEARFCSIMTEFKTRKMGICDSAVVLLCGRGVGVWTRVRLRVGCPLLTPPQ